MKIDHYIDDCFSIVDGTLISCRSEHRKLVIPAEVNGHRIYRIGSGCCIGGGTDTVIISEGIRELGEEAFVNSAYLEKVILPASLEKAERYGGLGIRYHGIGKPPIDIFLNRCLTETVYERLLAESIKLTNGDRLLSGNFAELDEFNRVLKSYGNLSAPVTLCPGMGNLFVLDNEKVIQLSCEHSDEMIAEGEMINHNSFIRRAVSMLAGRKSRVFLDNESETVADKAMQRGDRVFPKNMLLASFSKEKVRKKRGKVLVCFRIFFERVFIPVISEVRCKGQTAYIYSEEFLNNEKERPFLRVDNEDKVFDASGEHIDGKEFYAKYKFMAMLS